MLHRKGVIERARRGVINLLRFGVLRIKKRALWQKRGWNVKRGHARSLARVLISHLEMLSVTRRDRWELSLTWMAYVSLSKHAFMRAASLISSDSVTSYHKDLLLSLIFPWIFCAMKTFILSYTHLSAEFSLLSVIFFCNTTSRSFSL